MLPIRCILHPSDFSEQSRAAFELACSLACDYSAELLVMHVYSSPAFFPDGIALPLPTEDLDRARAQLEETLPTNPTVQVKHLFVEGNPVDQILEHAKKDAIDLIVMGTNGSGGLSRLFMGSVAESVTRKATCPVLTIRKPFREAIKPLKNEALPSVASV